MIPLLRVKYAEVFPDSIDSTHKPRHFHLLGVDIILDEHGDPSLLEINSSPSARSWRNDALDEIGLYMDPRCFAQAVELGMKPASELEKIGRFKSYYKIMDSQILKNNFPRENAFCDLIRVFSTFAGENQPGKKRLNIS